jgi:hypothetical protein
MILLKRNEAVRGRQRHQPALPLLGLLAGLVLWWLLVAMLSRGSPVIARAAQKFPQASPAGTATSPKASIP